MVDHAADPLTMRRTMFRATGRTISHKTSSPVRPSVRAAPARRTATHCRHQSLLVRSPDSVLLVKMRPLLQRIIRCARHGAPADTLRPLPPRFQSRTHGALDQNGQRRFIVPPRPYPESLPPIEYAGHLETRKAGFAQVRRSAPDAQAQCARSCLSSLVSATSMPLFAQVRGTDRTAWR